MPKYDQGQAECLVFTFKEGLLSKIAHDLKLDVTRFSVDLSPSAVRAEFDTSSLRVLHAMKDGKENPDALSDADKSKIADQIAKEVLHAGQHPTAVFTSRSVTRRPDGGYSIDGDLSLHGVTKSLHAETQVEANRQVVSIELHQPDYGVTPFKAMMGTLKVKADVTVRLSVPGL
jgi:polyisoprenoid-binding protein YceI